MTVVGQPQVVYTYDNANRLTQVHQGTSTVTIGYDDADRRTSVTYPNTNKIEYLYNAASELTTVTYKKGTTTLGTLTYTYDLAGNRIKTGGTFARSNLPPALTTTNYNANNQQLTFGTTTETYDLNGNLETSTDAGVTTTYTWNVRNQLTGISRTGLTATFTYDSFGRRTGRTVNGVVVNYVYDGLNSVQEKSGATVTANLLTGLGIDEFFTRTDGVGVRALLPDALGSTVALGDGTGTLQTQYTYEPFGVTTQTGSASTSSYKFTGREDDGSGLSYYRARYYHPRLQRFVAEDPLGFGGGDLNLYEYVLNSPLRFMDPQGTDIAVIMNGPVASNPAGHVSIAITGQGVYSFGTPHPLGQNLSDYMADQSKVRSSNIYVISTTPDQDARALAVLQGFAGSKMGPVYMDNCSTRSNSALTAAGIIDLPMNVRMDSLFQPQWPAYVAIRAMFAGATRYSIPQGSTSLPSALNQFNH